MNTLFESHFVKTILVPYLSEVFYSLVRRDNKDYLSKQATKQYLNLPELLSERIISIINANGDERIDHDEFVEFFLTILMGSEQQKMRVAYQCFDFENEHRISKANIKQVLRHIPQTMYGLRYGLSFSDELVD